MTIGDWSEDKLVRFISGRMNSEQFPKPKSLVLETATIADVLRITNRVEFSPQAIRYIQSFISGATAPAPHKLTHEPGGTDALTLLTDASFAAANKDGAAGVYSLRRLGVGALNAAAGNDARFTDSRTPTGPAGGDLTGTYPNPTVDVLKITAAKIANATITDVQVAAANKDGVAGTASMRTLGTGATQAAAGNDSRFSDPSVPYDPGTITITTERFLIQSGQLKLSGSEQFALQGTSEIVLTDMDGHLENIRGAPRSMYEPIVVPNNYDYPLYNQLSLTNSGQLELRGTAQLILSDDMGTPGQLTLAGRV